MTHGQWAAAGFMGWQVPAGPASWPAQTVKMQYGEPLAPVPQSVAVSDWRRPPTWPERGMSGGRIII